MYIYIYIYIYIIYIYICIWNHENSVLSRLSIQWLCRAPHALGHMMYGYTLLVPMNQRVLKKLSKDHLYYDHLHIIHQ